MTDDRLETIEVARQSAGSLTDPELLRLLKAEVYPEELTDVE